MLSENLQFVRQRIQQVCARSRRDPSSVTLVGVTKGILPEAIREAATLGLTELGENRIQEAKPKMAALHDAGIRWHLIGHLQRNKAKDAVELFPVMHSLDSVALAEELERQVAKRTQGSRLTVQGKGTLEPPTSNLERLEVFIQVNISGEATKFGCAPGGALSLARTVTQLPHLRLKGLMTIPPLTGNPEEARPHFRRLRELRDEIQDQLFRLSLATHHSSLLLSMGMSHDFEVAIEEGADVVRIGTAIFH